VIGGAAAISRIGVKAGLASLLVTEYAKCKAELK
jgi:hypothetical protein